MIRNSRKGFTLAELLVVVAIIGVLIAIVVPTFGNSVEKAREAADVSNLRAAFSEAVSKNLLEPAADNKVTISNVKLSSSGSLDHVDASSLPFSLPDKFSFSDASYAAVFDFSTVRPSVALTVESST